MADPSQTQGLATPSGTPGALPFLAPGLLPSNGSGFGNGAPPSPGLGLASLAPPQPLGAAAAGMPMVPPQNAAMASGAGAPVGFPLANMGMALTAMRGTQNRAY